MKTKLLRRLRAEGQNQISVHSVTKSGGTVIGMSYGYNEDKYAGLFFFGNTEKMVKKKAERIYIEDYLKAKRRQ